jgi:hypothetical protein
MTGSALFLRHCKNAMIGIVGVVELLDYRVRYELEALPPYMRAHFRRAAELIQRCGLEFMRRT